MFRAIHNKTLEKIGEETIKIRTFGKTKQRITCVLCILANGMKLPPMLVFKGVPEGTLEHRLNKLKLVIENKMYVVCQSNAWVDSSTFLSCLNKAWFRTYPFKQISGTILYYDKASSHLTDEVVNMFNINKCQYRLKPPELTFYCQRLDLGINKLLKIY